MVSGVLSDVGCTPLIDKTVVSVSLINESTGDDGWSGASSAGHPSRRVYSLSWGVMLSGDVDHLKMAFDNAELNHRQVLLEIEDQVPLIGRIVGKPSITHHTGLAWSARVVVEEDL